MRKPLLVLPLVLATLESLGQAPPAASPVPASPEQQVAVTVSKAAGDTRIRLAIPPAVAPITPDFQTRVVDPFQSAVTDDLSSTSTFSIPDPGGYPRGSRPPSTREHADSWILAGADVLLDVQIQPQGDQVTVVAEIWDLKTLRSRFGKRYTGDAKSSRRIGHTLANDILREFTGRIGPFLTKLTFTSDRDGRRNKEVYLMDYDGENQRRVTFHNSLAVSPDFSPDGSRIVYQLLTRDRWVVSWVTKETGEIRQVPLPQGVKAAFSPTVSPDGRSVTFCGSMADGNPEIFTSAFDGSGSQRLTDSAATDTTPVWAPNGRELAFTSNRQGNAQLFLMDVEGANVRRVTVAGNHNDQAAFSPDGGRMTFTCRNEGDNQICVMDLLSGRVLQISGGPGSHENPSWSPDGTKIAWEVTKGGSTQIVVANVDGSSPRQLTSAGNNSSPAWSKTLQ